MTGEPVADEDVDAVLVGGSVIGWTMANVAKRMDPHDGRVAVPRRKGRRAHRMRNAVGMTRGPALRLMLKDR
jgi:hypothetical protein